MPWKILRVKKEVSFGIRLGREINIPIWSRSSSEKYRGLMYTYSTKRDINTRPDEEYEYRSIWILSTNLEIITRFNPHVKEKQ